MKVEKLAKNGQMGQNSQPLSPQWYTIPQLSYQEQLRDLQLGSEKVSKGFTIRHQKIMSSLFEHMCVKQV